MSISKDMLRQYLAVVAINAGLMDTETAKLLANYDKATFTRLLETRIRELQSEAESGVCFFPPEYYSQGVTIVTETLNNLEEILDSY